MDLKQEVSKDIIENDNITKDLNTNQNIKPFDNDIDNTTIYSKTENNIEKEIDEYSNSNIDLEKMKDDNDLKSIQNSLNLEEKPDENETDNPIQEIKDMNLNRLNYFDVFKCGMKIRYNSHTYFNFIKNKLTIPKNNFKEVKVVGDDNCYYKCLSKFLYCKIEYDDKIKKTISTFCKENINEINNYEKKAILQNGEIMNTIDYINNMDKSDNWAPNIDIMISCHVFEMNIGVYKFSDDKNNLEYINAFIYKGNNVNYPTMILLNDSSNHFNFIYPYISRNNMINDKSQIFKDNDDLNPYPKYTGLDKNLYLNIFNFLNNGIVNGKRTWPDYIEYIQDRKFRSKKKSEFYQKVGITNECNVEHDLEFKKKICKYENFDLIASQDKYVVENSRLYLTRYEYNNLVEKKLMFKKYLIPYQKDLNNILRENHDENNHPGRDETIESIKNNNIYWISMNTDVENYLKNCSLCGSKYIAKSETETEN